MSHFVFELIRGCSAQLLKNVATPVLLYKPMVGKMWGRLRIGCAEFHRAPSGDIVVTYASSFCDLLKSHVEGPVAPKTLLGSSRLQHEDAHERRY